MRKVVLVAVAVLAGCGTGTVATQGLAHLLLPTGPQTATIRINLTTSRPPSFSGDIAGQPLTGRYSAGTVSARALCPQRSPLSSPGTFTYSGTYDGQAFSFSGCTAAEMLGPTGSPTGTSGNPLSSTTGMRLTFRVRGHVGSAALSGSAIWTIKNVSSSCEHAGCTISMPFSGSIGSQKLSGTATITEESSRVGEIVAKLTVS